MLWFWFAFLSGLVMLNLCLFGHLCIMFGEMSIHVLGPFFKSGYLIFVVVVECKSSLYILDINLLLDTWFTDIFFHFVRCFLTLDYVLWGIKSTGIFARDCDESVDYFKQSGHLNNFKSSKPWIQVSFHLFVSLKFKLWILLFALQTVGSYVR